MGKQANITSFFSGINAGKKRVENEHDARVCDLTVEDEPDCAPVLQEKAATRETKAEIRARWQRKVLGDNDSSITRNRSRTQADVERHDATHKTYTPLEKQVVELQQQYHPDCVLAIECGYKYRFFGIDAEIASKVLGIFSYPDRNFLTASVPTARIQHHVRRLVSAGYEVGIVSQTETAAIKASDAKSRSQPFKRELTQRYTQSTIEAIQPDGMGRNVQKVDERHHSNEANSSYVVCVVEGDDGKGTHNSVTIGITAVECSTGSIIQASFVDCAMRMQLESCLQIARPSDLLLMDGGMSPGTQRMLDTYCIRQGQHVRVRRVNRSKYALGGASTAITSYLSDMPVDSILDLNDLVLQAMAHTLDYLDTFGLSQLIQSEKQIRAFSDVDEMLVSSNALQQLEILRNSDDGTEYGSLIWLLDQTKTAFGGRMMRTWVTTPLKRVSTILSRLDAVEEIVGSIDHSSSIVSNVISCLRRFNTDLERSLGRIIHGTILPMELSTFLDAFKDIGIQLGIEKDETAGIDSISSPLLQELLSNCVDHDTALFAQNISISLHKEACESNNIVMVFNDDNKYKEVAEKRALVIQHERSLQELRPMLAKSLGVASLEYVKIQHQGDYLIEVPVQLEKRVPSTWVRVSSTKKMLRFLPPEVKAELEQLELAKEYLLLTAKSSWKTLLREIGDRFVDFKNIIHSLASLDCLISFASLSSRQGYVKPKIVSWNDNNPLYRVSSGRHPIIEVINEHHSFVPNDIDIGSSKEVCRVVTGPNMGGKSVYIKQAAIIAYMAQIGCFVPAKTCILKPFDAIFTRMGAADSIALGRSTFLEELAEASQILTKATKSSLVIVDELGRGTSSSDGYSIAAATMKYLASEIGCASLFVTHYPEIAIESSSAQIQEASPYYMGYLVDSNNSENPRVAFTYTLTRGIAHSSYGLHVASMAGLPEAVVQQASRISSMVRDQVISGTQNIYFAKLLHLLSCQDSPPSREDIEHMHACISSMLQLADH